MSDLIDLSAACVKLLPWELLPTLLGSFSLFLFLIQEAEWDSHSPSLPFLAHAQRARSGKVLLLPQVGGRCAKHPSADHRVLRESQQSCNQRARETSAASLCSRRRWTYLSRIRCRATRYVRVKRREQRASRERTQPRRHIMSHIRAALCAREQTSSGRTFTSSIKV